jgi:hypothetical protein
LVQQWRTMTLVIVLVFGALVPVSYVHGVATAPGKASALWGGVPRALLPTYTAMMFVAAAGFLAFTSFILFGVDWGRTSLGFGGSGLPVPVLYLMILIPSALWMAMTIRMAEAPSAVLWASIRVVLFLVGLGGLGIIAVLLSLNPRPSGAWFWSAVAGAVGFFVHTGILDALVWPAYFPH